MSSDDENNVSTSHNGGIFIDKIDWSEPVFAKWNPKQLVSNGRRNSAFLEHDDVDLPRYSTKEREEMCLKLPCFVWMQPKNMCKKMEKSWSKRLFKKPFEKLDEKDKDKIYRYMKTNGARVYEKHGDPESLASRVHAETKFAQARYYEILYRKNLFLRLQAADESESEKTVSSTSEDSIVSQTGENDENGNEMSENVERSPIAQKKRQKRTTNDSVQISFGSDADIGLNDVEINEMTHIELSSNSLSKRSRRTKDSEHSTNSDMDQSKRSRRSRRTKDSDFGSDDAEDNETTHIELSSNSLSKRSRRTKDSDHSTNSDIDQSTQSEFGDSQNSVATVINTQDCRKRAIGDGDVRHCDNLSQSLDPCPINHYIDSEGNKTPPQSESQFETMYATPDLRDLYTQYVIGNGDDDGDGDGDVDGVADGTDVSFHEDSPNIDSLDFLSQGSGFCTSTQQA